MCSYIILCLVLNEYHSHQVLLKPGNRRWMYLGSVSSVSSLQQWVVTCVDMESWKQQHNNICNVKRLTVEVAKFSVIARGPTARVQCAYGSTAGRRGRAAIALFRPATHLLREGKITRSWTHLRRDVTLAICASQTIHGSERKNCGKSWKNNHV